MKKCLNCKNINKDKDTYCRNCGTKLHTSYYYILINIATIVIIVGLILMTILFIASFIV